MDALERLLRSSALPGVLMGVAAFLFLFVAFVFVARLIEASSNNRPLLEIQIQLGAAITGFFWSAIGWAVFSIERHVREMWYEQRRKK